MKVDGRGSNGFIEKAIGHALEDKDIVAAETLKRAEMLNRDINSAYEKGLPRSEVLESARKRLEAIAADHAKARLERTIPTLKEEAERIERKVKGIGDREFRSGNQTATLREYEITSGAISDDELAAKSAAIGAMDDMAMVFMDPREVETVASELRRRGKAQDADQLMKTMKTRNYREPYKNLPEYKNAKSRADYFTAEPFGAVRVFGGLEFDLGEAIDLGK